MKDAEDEAFEDIERKQNALGGGFPAKRNMAADKNNWNEDEWRRNNWRCSHGWLRGEQCEICNAAQSAQEPLIDRLRKTASKGVSVWGDLMLEAADVLAQPAQEQRQPLTLVQIRQWWASENGMEDCEMAKFDDFLRVVRAVEAAHNIGAKP
jgi:hypothetical protein